MILHDFYNPITHSNGYVTANDVTYQPIRRPEILALANLFGEEKNSFPGLYTPKLYSLIPTVSRRSPATPSRLQRQANLHTIFSVSPPPLETIVPPPWVDRLALRHWF